MSHPWIADRTKTFDSSGIRKVFDLASQMKKPIDLSIVIWHPLRRHDLIEIDVKTAALTWKKGTLPLAQTHAQEYNEDDEEYANDEG